MRLLSLTADILSTTKDHWLPFLPLIARRSKEPIAELIRKVMHHEVWVVLITDDAVTKASALIGVRIHDRGNDRIGELIWAAGYGRKDWQHLLPELEKLLRDAGCVECRPLCRPGWRKMLERAGYRVTHIQMEKNLNG